MANDGIVTNASLIEKAYNDLSVQLTTMKYIVHTREWAENIIDIQYDYYYALNEKDSGTSNVWGSVSESDEWVEGEEIQLNYIEKANPIEVLMVSRNAQNKFSVSYNDAYENTWGVANGWWRSSFPHSQIEQWESWVPEGTIYDISKPQHLFLGLDVNHSYNNESERDMRFVPGHPEYFTFQSGNNNQAFFNAELLMHEIAHVWGYVHGGPSNVQDVAYYLGDEYRKIFSSELDDNKYIYQVIQEDWDYYGVIDLWEEDVPLINTYYNNIYDNVVWNPSDLNI